MFEVVRKDGAEHLNVIAHVLRDHRTESSVDHASKQHVVITRTTFALAVATTADFASCVILFLIHQLERQEIHAIARFVTHRDVTHTRPNFNFLITQFEGVFLF